MKQINTRANECRWCQLEFPIVYHTLGGEYTAYSTMARP